MLINYEHYTYKVTWSQEGGEYIGLCHEFPSLSFLHTDQIKALEGIRDTVRGVTEDMESNGEVLPTPLSEKSYSGKFQVRLTPDQHRSLAMRAMEQGVSLNRYINYKLML